MEIMLSKDLEQYIEKKVETEGYQSAEHVVSEGLMLLIEREEGISDETNRLRVLVAEGLAQIERGELLDGREVFRRLKNKAISRQDA